MGCNVLNSINNVMDLENRPMSSIVHTACMLCRLPSWSQVLHVRIHNACHSRTNALFNGKWHTVFAAGIHGINASHLSSGAWLHVKLCKLRSAELSMYPRTPCTEMVVVRLRGDMTYPGGSEAHIAFVLGRESLCRISVVAGQTARG